MFRHNSTAKKPSIRPGRSTSIACSITTRQQNNRASGLGDRRPPYVPSKLDSKKNEHQAWAGPPRMFHHIMTREQKIRASGLGWTCAGLPHIRGVHRNLHTNPVDPSSPQQKLTHTNKTYCFMHTEFYRCLVLSPSCGLHSSRAQDKAERLSPVDPGISRGVTDLHPSQGHTPRNTRDRSITRS